MEDQKPELVDPCEELREAYLDYIDEVFVAEEKYIHGSGMELKGDFGEFVRLLQDYAKGINLPQGWVPGSSYWLLSKGRILGVSNLRHELTDHLRCEGGRIGYSVRPSERGKGYGTLMLKLVLEKAKELGLEKMLVTCDKDNLASARVINKNGGKLDNELVAKESEKLKQRHWIEL